jgi:iron(III) transport system substrate-binding protein
VTVTGYQTVAQQNLTCAIRIRERRRQLGLTQAEVVDRVSRPGSRLSSQALSAIENGRRLAVGRLPDLAAALECTVSYLLGLATDPDRWEPDDVPPPARVRPPGERAEPDANGRAAPPRRSWILGPDLPDAASPSPLPHPRYPLAEAVMRFSIALGAVVPILLAGVAACGSPAGSPAGAPAGSSSAAASNTSQLTLYTSVTQNTVTAVVNGFAKADPGVKVSVFRATTGQLNARIAADQHSGGLRADVIWATDPLSMESYAQQNLFRPWPVPGLAGVPAADKTTYFWGTRELYLVIVAHKGLTPLPRNWADLTSPAYQGKVALPDPAAAGSAFAALGYFATAPGFGLGFYRALKANGAVQVATIPEVVTDVAEGRYQLGITLDSEVRSAIAEGSPVVMDWPADGAISLYSPIAETVAATGGADAAARAFLSYVLSPAGQATIGKTGWQPVLPGIAGPPRPAGATEVYPGWSALFGRQQQILRQYQAIFGA